MSHTYKIILFLSQPKGNIAKLIYYVDLRGYELMVPLMLHRYSITKPGKLKYDFMSHTNKIRNIVSKTRKAILKST